MSAIEVRDLVKSYRGSAQRALDGVSFDVGEGQLFCLLGPNGAGKTTTVSILTTTLAPTSGEVRICGRDLAADQRAVRQEVGIVFQGASLDLNLTAEENIRLHAVLYGLYPWRPSFRLMSPAYRAQVGELAGLLGIEDLLRRPTRALSGGTRRKLEIVRALMHRPPVLFLDEPTAGLDPESRRSLWDYLGQARQTFGTTVFLTTHYLEEAESADRVCVLAGGRILESGSPAEVKAGHGSGDLLVDATDRGLLRRELAGAGLGVEGPPPWRIPLGGASVQDVVRALTCELTALSIVEPTLEEVYLSLLAGAGHGGS